MNDPTKGALIGAAVAAFALLIGLSAAALSNAKASLRVHRIAAFVALASLASVLLYVALSRA